MDENASRAVFLGVSVFVAIITITLIVNFYSTAKDSAAVANRYDISSTGNTRVDKILEKEKITGLELRYLLDYYQGDEIYDQIKVWDNGVEVSIPDKDYWSNEVQKQLDDKIRANYNYILDIQKHGVKYKIVAIFEN